jgi:hypothetical protein
MVKPKNPLNGILFCYDLWYDRRGSPIMRGDLGGEAEFWTKFSVEV